MDGPVLFVTSVSATPVANTALVVNPGNVTATTAGEVFSAIRTSTTALITSPARTEPRVSTRDRDRTPAVVHRGIRAPIARAGSLTSAHTRAASTAGPAK